MQERIPVVPPEIMKSPSFAKKDSNNFVKEKPFSRKRVGSTAGSMDSEGHDRALFITDQQAAKTGSFNFSKRPDLAQQIELDEESSFAEYYKT